MAFPDFLHFDPVPLRARHDGWTPELQRDFILRLARGHRPDEAARRLGKSRQTAYVLRGKPGAESFAAAWDAALSYARRARLAVRSAAPSASASIPVSARARCPDPAATTALGAPRTGVERSHVSLAADRSDFHALLDHLYPPGADKPTKLTKLTGSACHVSNSPTSSPVGDAKAAKKGGSSFRRNEARASPC